jgi:hypothetical protein
MEVIVAKDYRLKVTCAWSQQPADEEETRFHAARPSHHQCKQAAILVNANVRVCRPAASVENAR